MKLFVGIILFLFSMSSFCQVKDSGSVFKPYFQNKPIDANLLLKAPFKWNKKDILAFGLVVSSGVIAYQYDEKITNIFIENRKNGLNNIAKYMLQPLGNAFYVYPAVLATMGVACLTHNKKLAFLSLTSTKSLIFTGLTTQMIKYAAHRSRPYESNGNSHIWGGPSLDSQHHSFVSGHSSTAFSLATSIASVYNDMPLVKWTAYSLATCVELSRVYDNKHWSSDVISGAALGYAISRFCYNNDKKRQNNNTLVLLPSSRGLQILYSF
ncbi:MAG: phosphatase PAP2 family protein [Bacteroidota bacterium]